MRERKYLFVVGVLLIAALVTSSLMGCTRRKPEVEPIGEDKLAQEATAAIGAAAVTPRPVIQGEPTALIQPTVEQPTMPPLPTSTPVSEEGVPAPTEIVEQPTTIAYEAQAVEGVGEIIVAATQPTVDTTGYLPLATPPVVPATQPTAMPAAVSAPEGGVHTVQRGETLYSIALRYGTTYQELMRVNNIANANFIYVGQRLALPGTAAAPAPAQPVAPVSSGQVYIVKPGDNLFRIAINYGVPLQELASANHIFNPRIIHVGQQLVIPRGAAAQPAPSQSGGQRNYVVQRGDTLFAIATRYGTTVQALMLANNIANRNFIYPGQTLVIP